MSITLSAVRLRHGLLTAVGSLAIALAAQAAEPNGNAIFQESPQETANKQVVLAWSQLLGSGRAQEAFEKYVSKDFVEHSHLVTRHTKTGHAGYAEALAFLSRDLSTNGAPGSAPPAATAPAAAPAAAAPTRRLAGVLVADDDHVTMYGGIGADIFRVENGKITDHWDASPPTPVTLKGERRPPKAAAAKPAN